jgi:hypothetical protein
LISVSVNPLLAEDMDVFTEAAIFMDCFAYHPQKACVFLRIPAFAMTGKAIPSDVIARSVATKQSSKASLSGDARVRRRSLHEKFINSLGRGEPSFSVAAYIKSPVKSSGLFFRYSICFGYFFIADAG